jgi:hypothetical protein
MKLKLAIATCVAALALPMTPAIASDAIPGTCFETNVGGGGGTTTYQCECLVGVPVVRIESTNPLSITLIYCIANL